MGIDKDLTPGDKWPAHYRGFSLQVSPDESVWWQVYQGTERLELDPVPTDIVESLLDIKHIGGRIHVTEDGAVLTRVEDESTSSGYRGIYVGSLEFEDDAALVPSEDPEFSIALRPSELTAGDLWPSVYDGSRYSFADDRVWWHNGATHKRHPVPEGLPNDLESTIQRFKRQGGSFRVLPWGDVISLVPVDNAPPNANEQFRELPRVVQNIIKLRKERGVEMLPLYIGQLDDTPLEVVEPRSLTDELTEQEREELTSWAGSLGETTDRSKTDHEVSDTSRETSETETDDPEEPPELDDDPLEWMKQDINATGEHIDDLDS